MVIAINQLLPLFDSFIKIDPIISMTKHIIRAELGSIMNMKTDKHRKNKYTDVAIFFCGKFIISKSSKNKTNEMHIRIILKKNPPK